MTPLFEDLVHMDLRTLATWIRSESNIVNLGQQEGRGLVEIFSSRLVEEAEDVGPDEWNGLAGALDRAMLSADLDPTESAVRQINLMSALMAAVGPSSDSLRNPDAAMAIFLGALPMEFNEASALVANWRRASQEDIRRLRSIRNLLTPLVGAEALISDAVGKEAIGKWMTLLDQLP
ncbi:MULTISPECIES: hypothetical protein [unclassified Micromonospora]|uniref:hypothetical protein n=1 Tax=unclassified Micromonospora TaxID=2617518 RepID=UPI003632226B